MRKNCKKYEFFDKKRAGQGKNLNPALLQHWPELAFYFSEANSENIKLLLLLLVRDFCYLDKHP